MGREGGQSFYPSEIPSRIDRDEVTGLARRETRNPEFEEKSRGVHPLHPVHGENGGLV